MTDSRGVAVFESGPLAPAVPLVAFQVEAALAAGEVVRPSGGVLIDSCLIERIARLAAELPPAAPIVFASAHDDVELIDLSPEQSLLPLVAAVDPAWFLDRFPVAVGVVDIDETPGPGCVDLLVTSLPELPPLQPSLSGSCEAAGDCSAIAATLAGLWAGTVTTWQPGSGISREEFEHLAGVVRSYAGLARRPAASPVGGLAPILGAAGLSMVPLSSAAAAGATGSVPLEN